MNRLTITLPDDLYAMARSYAVANRKSISRAIGELLRRGREPSLPPGFLQPKEMSPLVHPLSGFPIAEGDGGPFNSDDVRKAEDDEDIRHLEIMGLSREENQRGLIR